MITATGLGSGLDISGLVTQLVAAERAGSDLQLARQTAKLNSKFSALGSVKSVLASFQSSLSSLNNLDSFAQYSATSSTSSELGISVVDSAIPNNYNVDVTQLAAAHALASTAISDSDSTMLGTGTLTIRFGNTDYNSGTDSYNGFTLNPESSVATIEIDSSNNTLEGIMNTINDADVGVSAAIVNDGVGFRLLLSSAATGEVNSLEISVTDDDANNIDAEGLSRFAFNSSATNIEQTVSAQDAELTLNGLAVTSASNTVDSVIPGATLDLKQLTSGTVSLSIQEDYSAIKSGVNSFIAGYNQFINTINTLTAYDVENNIPAAMVGDFALRSINAQIDAILRNSVEGLLGSTDSLAQLGISTNKSGALVLDSSKLDEVLSESPAQVAQVFAAIGIADDANISYSGASATAEVGSYAIDISAVASSGVFTSAPVLPDFGGGGSIIIDADNDNLTLQVDGVDMTEITLTAGSYTDGEALANEIQAQINGNTSLRDANRTVNVTYESASDSFSITSNALGSESTVNVIAVDTNSASELGFSVSDGIPGVDVVGTIDGIAAVGVGNILTAGSGSGAEGLSLKIEGLTTGSRGSVNFSRGIANQLKSLLDRFLDIDGALEDRIDTFKERIDEVEERRATLELRWQAVEARYSRQFNALDLLLAGLQSTSTYMEEQFKNLVEPYTGRS
jgi:flagellar hook-associated protein 2